MGDQKGNGFGNGWAVNGQGYGDGAFVGRPNGDGISPRRTDATWIQIVAVSASAGGPDDLRAGDGAGDWYY